MDAFISRATPDIAKRLLTSAIMGNQNMIRIWGGGLYQPSWFYDMCDEMGILVWQEFMFAVALYPRDNVCNEKCKICALTYIDNHNFYRTSFRMLDRR